MNKLLIFALFSLLFSSYVVSQVSIECTICQFVVGWTEGELSANATEQEVETLLDSACSVIFSWDTTLISTCDNLINTYFPDLVQYILAEESPDVACTGIGLCSNSTSKKVIPRPIIPVKKVEDNSSCAQCLNIVAIAENFISEDSTEQEIELLLDTLCTLFPDNATENECDALIQTFTPEAIQLMIQNEPPSVVCTQAEACTFGEIRALLANKLKKAKKVNGAIECSLCQAAVGYAEAFVSTNSSEAEVEALLDKACNIFPNSTQQMCDGIVNTLVTDGFQLIVNDEPPSVVCTQVGLCTSYNLNIYKHVNMLISAKRVKKFGKKNGKKNVKKHGHKKFGNKVAKKHLKKN